MNLKKVPINWLSLGNRTSPKSGTPRKAIDPWNACLNYCYAVLETRVRQQCVLCGVDPDLGILHSDHSTRTSLVFDLMEPIRPKIDKLLFDWIVTKKFNPKDFFETREGICKVGPEITTQIIPLVKGLNMEIARIIKNFAGFFKNKTVITKPAALQRNEELRHISKPRIKTAKQALLNFDENQPIDEECKCLECGVAFIPTDNRQRYCCSNHKNVYVAREKRKQRLAGGKCPRCGNPIPEPVNGAYKEKLAYCHDCVDYWKARGERKKAKSC